MAWSCFSCLNCDVLATREAPNMCPNCGHPVDEWEGDCQHCPSSRDCKVNQENL